MTALCGLESCARPAPSATICEQHWWELDRALKSVPWLLAELDVTLARQDQGPRAGKVSGSSETPVAYGLGASTARAWLGQVLAAWSGLVWPDLGAEGILLELPHLRAYDQLPKLTHEVLGAVYRATVAIDLPAHRSIIDVGPCPEDCPGKVKAFIPAGSERPPRMVCDTGEGHWWPAEQWVRVGKRIRDKMGAQ